MDNMTNLLATGICKSYNMYKSLHVLEDYLVKLRKHNGMSQTKIRKKNNNRLPAVAGRYDNICREESLCTKCRCTVGDDYHIMLLRPNEAIVELRNILYSILL